MYVNAVGFKEQLVKNRENRILEEAKALAQELLQENTGFALWGAGNTGKYTRRFLEEQSDGKLRPEYVVDNNPSLWGRDNIIGPEEFFCLKECPPHLVVAVYVADQVLEQIRQAGYKGKVSCLQGTMLYAGADVWELYDGHLDELEDTFRLLADEKSKATFIGYLNFMRTLDDKYLRHINEDSRQKLMDASLLKPHDKEFFVDVGAFIGDTIDAFLKISHRKYKGIVALEPDKDNFSALCRYVSDQKLERVELKQIAAGENNEKVRFRAGMSESCRIGLNGSEEVEVRKLDQLPEASGVTLLKVSANDLDLKVLKGAEGLLRSNGPKISTYAGGSRLWEIPAYIKKVNDDYKIYLRHYGFSKQAMICYAVL